MSNETTTAADDATTAPLTLPTADASVKPGHTTSEHAFNYVCLALAALLGTGAIPTTGWVGQLAAIATAALLALGYNVGRVILKSKAADLAVLVVVLAFSAGSLTACGSSAQQRQTTLQTSLATTDAACATFAAYDLKHQHDLEAAALAAHATNSEVTDTIAKWRTARAPVLEACKTVLATIKAAATVTDDRSIVAVTAAGAILAGAIQSLGGSL